MARLEADKIDIVALALAKEKIQTIVEREWKKSKRGKTRQCEKQSFSSRRRRRSARMRCARWLSIESQVSVDKINQKTSSEFDLKQDNANKTTTKEAIVSQPTSLDGISNCESAIATPSIPLKLAASSIEVVNGKANSDPEFQEKNSNLEFSETAEVEITKIEAEDDWQPDLSGWSVFKNLST